VALQDLPPVRPARQDVEILDEEADDGRDRQRTGRQVELVQVHRGMLPIRVQVRPRHAPTIGRMPMEGHNRIAIRVSDLMDPFDGTGLPRATPLCRFLDDVAIDCPKADRRETPSSRKAGDSTLERGDVRPTWPLPTCDETLVGHTGQHIFEWFEKLLNRLAGRPSGQRESS